MTILKNEKDEQLIEIKDTGEVIIGKVPDKSMEGASHTIGSIKPKNQKRDGGIPEEII